MTKRIVVLGGGSAGTMVANKLARQLGEEIKKQEEIGRASWRERVYI